jgi:membrane-bound metal-dependent hydrolase YbcI (DUF457 family)
MPSPLGHALGGLSAGWLIAGVPGSPTPTPTPTSVEAFRRAHRGTVTRAVLFVAIGMAPDLDLLVGLHRMYFHSLGAALIVTLAAMALTRSSALRTTGTTGTTSANSAIIGLACGTAYASHILLDWLGDDATPPIGLMALWPISADYYQSNLHLFMSTTRRYRPGFWMQNATAMAYEIGMLLPIAAAVYWLRRREE